MQISTKKCALAVLILGCGSLIATTAGAESLESVLAKTYVDNPDINGERAKLRALDEEHPRTRSGLRPRINFDADITSTHRKTRPAAPTDGTRRDGGYRVSFIQPLFRGLRTINSMRRADALIYAGREDLRVVEQEILLRAVTTYADVIRDRALVRFRRNNLSVLLEQLGATKDRFNVGEVTKTDVAQAKSRYSRGASELSLAQASLKTSRAVYEQIIGHRPNGLRSPRPISKFLPRSLNASLQRGLNEHPAILGSTYREVAAIRQIHIIRGELLPEINVEGSFADRFHPSQGVDRTSTTIVQGTFRVPLYAGGEISARVRQAKQTVLERRHDVRSSKRLVRADIVASWGQISSIRTKLAADRSQVTATRTALNGVREEEKVGQRTVLNVLDAQQELLDAQVALAITKRDLVVARYSLLAATGRMSVLELGLRVDRYDPTLHYDRVKHKWRGRHVEEYNEDLEAKILANDSYFPAGFSK